MKKPEYCTAPDRLGDCLGCALSSYHRDCQNNPIAYQKVRLTLWMEREEVRLLKVAAASKSLSASDYVQILLHKDLIDADRRNQERAIKGVAEEVEKK